MPAAVPRLEDLPLHRGRRVLVRVDCNVPLRDGVVTDDLRISTALPTIEWLRERGAVVVVAGHLGRPSGSVDDRYSMAPVARRLGELLHATVELSSQVVGSESEDIVASARPGDVVMVENLRFEPGETTNDPAFAANLATLGDLYVNEAFGASHRSHASIVGPPVLLPHAAGRLLEREVEVLGGLLDTPERPFVAVFGGAKVGDKLGVLSALLERCDTVLVGGAMAFSFLMAQGISVGDSLVEPDRAGDCRDLLATGRVRIPSDFVIAREISDTAETKTVAADSIPDGWKGLDVGPATVAEYAAVVQGAATVMWNGPMGMFELEPFAAGTRGLAEAVAACPGFTVIGGGDSAAALRTFGLADRVDHVSTGGGATLEYVERGDLPGLEALRAPARRTT